MNWTDRCLMFFIFCCYSYRMFSSADGVFALPGMMNMTDLGAGCTSIGLSVSLVASLNRTRSRCMVSRLD